MLRGKWRNAYAVLFFLIVASCSGGGCSSGCAGCGVTPLAQGFPPADEIANAAAARVTRSGLDFLAANAGGLAESLLKSTGPGGALQYAIPTTPLSYSVVGITINATVCPSGPDPMSTPDSCEVDIQLGQAGMPCDPSKTSCFQLDAAAPGYTVPSPAPGGTTLTEPSLVASGTLLMRLQNLPISVDLGGIFGTIDITASIGTSFTCDTSTNTATSKYLELPFVITLPLVADNLAPRKGFTKIDGPNVGVYLGLTSSDLNLCSDCGGFCGFIPGCSSLCDSALNGIVGALFNVIEKPLVTQITSTVQKQLCTKASTTTTPECPDGTTNVGGTCMYGPGNTTCLPLQLGTEGHIDLSHALASISPGTTGALDFIFAAGGNMIPANLPSSATGSPADNKPYAGHTPNGMTLGLLAGALPQPQSQCVPVFNNVLPTGIPVPSALESNTVTPWAATDPPGPDFGIAIAQRFLNYAFGTVYNSGLLCLGVTTATTQQLSTGLLSLLIPSIKYLTFEQSAAAVAVVTRPQVPPTVVVGDGTDIVKDPLLDISLKQFAVDFYVFSEDRFIRAFTFTADLQIPVNLTSEATGLLPVIGSIVVNSPVVTNSELMRDSPTSIATGIGGVLGAAASTLTGSLKPINVAGGLATFGLTLTIPPDGIRKVTEGTDNFLAIFGDLGVGAPMPFALPHVRLVKKIVDPTVMTLATYDAKRLPSLAVHLASDDPGPVEYAYWIDEGAHSAWSTNEDLVVQNDTLFMQGNHVLNVVARHAGKPGTESATATQLPFTIDVLPPEITLQATSTGDATLSVWDFVTPNADIVVRYQPTDLSGNLGPWSGWVPLSTLSKIVLAGLASAVTVEAKDLEGNVGSVSIDVIRGRANPAGVVSSCGCSTPGRTDGTGIGWVLGFALLFVAGAVCRRKARFATAIGLSAVAIGGALSEGCNCGSTTGFGGNPKEGGGGGTEKSPPPGPMCGTTCNQPCNPGLPEGLVGAYTSTAKAKDGTIWVAGYNDSAITKEFSGLYGDLVVGKLDAAKSRVLWQTVDGLPALPKGTCADNDPTGWRHGISSPGEDVGLWTSIQMDANDHPIVSYYDTGGDPTVPPGVAVGSLKFASSTDGVKWNVHTVMQTKGSDIGRYSKMLVVNNVPTIAFLIMEPGTGGKMRSRVEVATAKTRTPASAADWSFEDAAVDDNGPCRAAFCSAPSVCIAATGSCEAPVTGCKTACDAGTVCVDTDGGTNCETPLAATYIDIYPNAFGDYITMANGPSGLGIVVYDRIDGVLEGLSRSGGSWQSQVIDGWTQPRKPSPGPDGGVSTDTGDVGVGASLFIATNGDWHISYVNGTTEALQYIKVPGGTKATDYPEIVDNGLSLDGKPFPDGLHIVGDDSFILVDDHDVVTIRYQDATSGTLRFATGTPQPGGTHQWAFHAVTQTGLFAGFFPHQIAGEMNVANWWRQTDPTTGDISGNVSFVNPM